MATVFLKRGRANPLWQGHPWVYSGAIAREDGAYQPGDVVDVADTEGRYIGRGFVNPRSQIRVRMVTTRDEAVDAALIARRVKEAVGLRARLGFPSEETNAYRLVNSEGDALPGVIVDVYGDVCAVQFTALGMKKREVELYDALERSCSSRRRSSRSRPAASRRSKASPRRRARCAATTRRPSWCAAARTGSTLEVDPLHGQKTGMFLDQRENRRRAGGAGQGRARARRLHLRRRLRAQRAARRARKEATCVDASGRALERVRAHAELNGISAVETVEADAFRFLETVRPRSYDLVVLDPPKFARARKDLDAAIKGYQRLNTLGMTACAEGALLATCSCSQLVDEEAFERMIAGAAKDAGRRVQLLETSSQGPDHPVPPAFPEGRYLKFLLCRVV